MQVTGWRSLLDAIRGRPAPAPEPVPDAPRVELISAWIRPDDGWSIASRIHAAAMRSGGIDVRLIGDGRESPYTLREDVLREVDGMVGDGAFDADLRILSYPLMSSVPTGRKLFEFRPDAMHCVFEVDRVDPDVARMLNKLRGVWAQCSYNRDALVAAGVKDVVLIPVAWSANDPLLSVPVPKRADRFLWIGRAEMRKNPERLIRAFCAAFKPGEAQLTMKCSRWKNPVRYPEPEETLHELGRRDVRIIRETYSRDQIVQLIADHDVYASSSRGEGFELSGYWSKLAGRRLVMTDSGGVRDYFSDGDVLVPATGRIAAPPEYGGCYLDHSTDDLAGALQKARSAPGPGSRAPESMRQDVVGREFRAWVDRLREKTP